MAQKTQSARPSSRPAAAGGALGPAEAGRRGRLVAVIVFYGLLGAFCVASTYQVARQVFASSDATSPFASCHDGLRALAAAVVRARNSAPGTDGEDAAIDRFRRALDPDWRYRDGVASSCQGSEDDEGALDAIERLRYAEEHAVRREAGDLAPLRRRVQNLVERDLAVPQPRAGQSDYPSRPPSRPTDPAGTPSPPTDPAGTPGPP